MIHIAICDDDKKLSSQIENILLAYGKREGLNIDIDVFYCGEDLIKSLQDEITFNLIYLDIEMKAVSGIEVGTYIRKTLRNHKIDIVYVSGKNNYDRQLFEVQPLHFIAKPITDSIVIDDLKLYMERANKMFDNFHYSKGNAEYAVPINEIIYFESVGRTMRIITPRGEDTFYSKMEDIILAVSKYHFLHMHRSYLVNFNHITTLKYSEVIMSNGTTITISRSKRKELRQLLLEE
jgi:DNA-binding LytR/AlgR family response regulator